MYSSPLVGRKVVINKKSIFGSQEEDAEKPSYQTIKETITIIPDRLVKNPCKTSISEINIQMYLCWGETFKMGKWSTIFKLIIVLINRCNSDWQVSCPLLFTKSFFDKKRFLSADGKLITWSINMETRQLNNHFWPKTHIIMGLFVRRSRLESDRTCSIKKVPNFLSFCQR